MNDELNKAAEAPGGAEETRQTDAAESKPAKGDGYVIPKKPESTKGWRFSLLATQEGCILLAGVAVALVYLGWIGLKFKVAPLDAQVLVGLTTTEVFLGRAAGMAFGYSLGLRHITVIPVCLVLETILVLTFYPLFVFACRQLLVFKSLEKFFNRIHEVAEQRKDFIRKYGVIGLFAFVWFPFFMTGPMVGCAIGFLLELPAWLNIVAVLSGTYLAVIGWGLLLHTVHQQIAAYSSYAALILMMLVVFIIIIAHLLQKNRQYRNSNR